MQQLRWIVSYLTCAIVTITIVAAQDSGDDDTGEPSTPSDPVLTGTFPPLDLPTNTVNPDGAPTASETTATATATATKPTTVTRPDIPYISPPLYSHSNATDPIFPPGSDSCQKCKYFYPKLKECNQIANRTLALLPRPDDPNDDGHDHNNNNNPPTTATAPTRAPAEFTTLLPFLNCICPNQGLAASKICLMCFQISGQPNFLDQLALQNVTNSLSAFQLACLESGDGTFVPPSARKGSSASGSNSGHGSETSLQIQTLVTMALTVIFAIASSGSM
ncbi:hypothetical protein EC968_005339 [Mortierella alpina]|nr:hypothetical protein EC968_005339 [Mortierella alpina]